MCADTLENPSFQLEVSPNEPLLWISSRLFCLLSTMKHDEYITRLHYHLVIMLLILFQPSQTRYLYISQQSTYVNSDLDMSHLTPEQ